MEIAVTETIAVPKIVAITEQIKWLENKAYVNNKLAEEHSSQIMMGPFLHYSVEASRYQSIADWLKEYQEILMKS